MSTIPLRELIREILPKEIFSDDPFLFLQRHASPSPNRTFPTLTKGIPNGILIFPGSFNPPHNGQSRLLEYVFDRAGEDINLVAAFIIPRDDDILEEDKAPDNIRLQLPLKARGQLWRASRQCDTFAMIWDYGEIAWREFQSALEHEAIREGYPLQFYLLSGPDDISMYNVPDPTVWGCLNVITSNVTSAAKPDFFQPMTNHLLKIKGGLEWQPVPYRQHALGRIASTKLGMGPLDTVDEDDEKYQQEVVRIHQTCRNVSTCRVRLPARNRKVVRFEVRFVARTGIADSIASEDDVAASDIRKRILSDDDARNTADPALVMRLVGELRRTRPVEEIDWDAWAAKERSEENEGPQSTEADVTAGASGLMKAKIEAGEGFQRGPAVADPESPEWLQVSIQRAEKWVDETPLLGCL